jgi:hypothetical protein
VLAVTEDVLDVGAVAVPVLDGGGLFGGRHIQVGQDEGVAVDGLGVAQLR